MHPPQQQPPTPHSQAGPRLLPPAFHEDANKKSLFSRVLCTWKSTEYLLLHSACVLINVEVTQL